MSEKREGFWMQTYTGRRFDPMNAKPADLAIEDIAHALNNICRYSGHCSLFYSVAQHSYLGAALCGQLWNIPRIQLGFLLHDASEAYFGDIIYPIKKQLPRYCLAEKRLEKAIWEKYVPGLTSLDRARIRLVDDIMLQTEAHQLFPSCEGWQFLVPALTADHIDVQRGTYDIREAGILNPRPANKYLFLQCFGALISEAPFPLALPQPSQEFMTAVRKAEMNL